jgi:predicted dehydrogenase
MTELKIAIVGCGQIADAHVSEVAKLPDARVVAVCDLEPLMAEQLAVRFGVPGHYSDFGELLARERPDVVHICTPPQSHLRLAEMAVDAGCHLVVEKPFALTYEDSLALVNCADRGGRKLTIGHTTQFDPVAEDTRRLIEAGALGEVVHVDSFFGYDLAGPFGTFILGSPDHWVHKLPGKLFQNNINHLLHKITEFVEDERPEIHALAWRRRSRSLGDVRDQLLDELRVTIRGSKVSAFANFSSHIKPFQIFARIYGTRDTAHVDYVGRTVTLASTPAFPGAVGRLAAGFSHAYRYALAGTTNLQRFATADFHYFAGLKTLFEKFYACIRDGGPVPIPMRDVLRIAWMMDEIFRQIADGHAEAS